MTQITDEFQIFASSENIVNRCELSSKAYMLAYLIGGLSNVKTANRGVACIGFKKRCQNIDNGGFTCAVTSEQRKNRSAFNR